MVQVRLVLLAAATWMISGSAYAATIYNNDNPNNLMAMASRPDASGKTEIEAADDFITSTETLLTGGSFTGLITSATGAAPTIGSVTVEIYRVFPNDSTNPPNGKVPTRANSPSDAEFVGRSTATADLTFTTTALAVNFSASNSVLNGINPSPNQTTGGDGAVQGTETQFLFTLTTPIDLPADHYFFIPQVDVTGGEFYWLSALRPITNPPGTPINPDLQAWIRNAALDPNWLRVGTDIVGGGTPPTFNAAFSLQGTVPEPSGIAFFMTGLSFMAWRRWRSNRT